MPYTPETIISDRSDARLLVFGLLLAWGSLIPYSVGLVLGWPVLAIVAGGIGGVGVIRTLILAGRVARRLRPRNKGTILASSFDEFNASLNLMRPSVIKRALLRFR